MAGDLSPLTDVEKELADVKSDCAALRAEVTILERQNTAIRVDIGRLRASKDRWTKILYRYEGQADQCSGQDETPVCLCREAQGAAGEPPSSNL